MRIHNKIIFSLLLFTAIISTNHINAQNKVTVEIFDFDYSPLKPLMEKNATELLAAVNMAYANKTSPVKISGVTDLAYKNLLKLWDSSPFRCIELDIIERAIMTPASGYELRNVPVYITEANKN